MDKESSAKKGESCSPTGCPLCTRDGMILAGIGLIVAFLMPPPFGFVGFIIFGFAYFLPSIKKLKLQKNIN
ncbi:MAG: hypothetical protein APG12_00573 [Candidatus Methanofastidiosum methylothiophilum]|uniref:Uncharacterized protein n=1 Tax=Candidatus Methanofastidiosum methylothiophilum TaxID=1705564 RepID=A0A150IMF0_9EURY|nr:MAG: hypothetical protein APG10_00470 [Candidatus Methanofastidiosum methylthiophilus]KYC48364.1 MAG: hypothetical protein APG11_00377 [Candidatus Methanofastidiosum methylthiophilus]KYC50771.1 MAG: hypothetical protein APG12_00573 [Candidatus Methanofastidiosum methylthiophilus]